MENNTVILTQLMEKKARIALFPIEMLQYLIKQRLYYVMFISDFLLWVLRILRAPKRSKIIDNVEYQLQ